MQRPTPGRWNRMHYSCLRGAGFEVSVCIMKAERLGIVMLYRSLVIFLSFSVCFSSLCFSLCHCFYHSIPFHSARFSLFFLRFFYTFALFQHRPTQAYTWNTFSCCSVGLLCPCFHCRVLWLIETGAVKRPHTRSQSLCLTTCRLWFDGLVPELASPWRDSALGFPVNEALCGWEG